jgi:hypothetical protein
MTILKLLSRASAVLLLFPASPAGAVEIAARQYFNFVDNRQASIIGPGGQFLSFGGDFTPNPSTGNPSTSVVAQQGNVVRIVPYLNAPGLPNQYFRSIPYDAGLTGAWTLTVTNPTTTNSPFIISTLPVCPTLCSGSNSPSNPFATPFIQNVTTNNLSTTPTFSWQQPVSAAPAGTTAGTTLIIYDASAGNSLVHATILTNPTQTSYTVPSTLTSGGALIAGHNYVVAVESSLFNTADLGTLPSFQNRGSKVETARSYFNFTPSSTPIVFPGPVNLPRVDPSGVFTFALDVSSGVPVLLDPSVAIGYDFQIGAGNPFFASAEFPDLGSFNYDLYLWNGSAWVFDATVAPLTEFFFGGNGVDRFRVLGIDPSLMISPTDVTAFVTQVTFAGSGAFTGTMTPIVAQIPEPAALALILIALGCGWFSRNAQMQRRPRVRAAGV